MNERDFTRSMMPHEIEFMLAGIETHVKRIRAIIEEENDPRPCFAELIRAACDALENYILHERER